MDTDWAVVATGSRDEVERDSRALYRVGVRTGVRQGRGAWELLVTPADLGRASDRLAAFDRVRDLDETPTPQSLRSRLVTIETAGIIWAALVTAVLVTFALVGSLVTIGVGGIVTLLLTGFIFSPFNVLFPSSTAKRPHRLSGQHGPVSQGRETSFRYRAGWITDLTRRSMGVRRRAPSQRLVPPSWWFFVMVTFLFSGMLWLSEVTYEAVLIFLGLSLLILGAVGLRTARWRIRKYGWNDEDPTPR